MRPIALLALLGCEHRPPVAVLLVCDGTGSTPEATCTSAAIAGFLRERAHELRFRPGSTVLVVTSARSYGTAQVTPVTTVPTFGRDDKAGVESWLAQVEQVVGQIRIPDDRTDPKVNQSDLLGAVSRAIAESGNYVGYDRELVVMSDGLFRSLGLSLESDKLDAPTVERAMTEGMLPWDLSGFQSISFCGWHGVTLSPDQVTRRQQIWTYLIDLGGGPVPGVFTTCQALVASVSR